VGILDFYDVVRCLFSGVGLVGLAAHPAPCGRTLHLAAGWKKKKKKFSKALELFRANLKNLMRWTGRRSAGLRWTPVDARDRDGPATIDSHGGGVTRRLGVTGLIT